MSAGIDLENVCCDFGSFRAVDNANVSIQPGEFFSFLGPSVIEMPGASADGAWWVRSGIAVFVYRFRG